MTAARSMVVRKPGAWFLAPVPGSEPSDLTIDGVVALLSAPAPHDGAPAPDDAGAAPAERADAVAPPWLWVGQVVDGNVVVEDGSGGTLALDEADLRLLDRVAGVTPVEALRSGAGLPASEVDRRVARLCASGRVLAAVPAGDPEPAPHAEAVAAPVAPPAHPEPAPQVASAPPVVVATARPEPRRSSLRALATQARRRIEDLADRRRPGSEPAAAPAPAAAAPVEPEAPEVDRRIPVYAVWPEDVGPLLSLGMLTAAARHWADGALNDAYEIRRPETAASFLEDVARRPGPAVMLCSNYVWSLVHNLDAAAQAMALNPQLVVVHGGPSTPKYADDGARFLDQHAAVADVLVRGEGEDALCELLEAMLAPDGGLALDPDRLDRVGGLTYRHPATGQAVRTDERERMADLDRLPSPYLTGEFDGIPPDAWKYTLSVETNRGCPYGCTFCDWGSATMSRIRKFDQERVVAEVEWGAKVGVHTITITDANFGIMSRDVETTRRIAEIRARTGHPHSLSWTAAKNTTKHLVKIMDLLVDSGLTVSTSLSLQTTDPTTLEVLARTNISTDHYVKLAADYRRRGYPLQGDLMLGLPGQTFRSYKDDLQFMLDHEIMVRSWPVQMLPNSPMNAPEYRAEHGIAVGDDNLVTSTATFSEADRARMWRFRTVDTIAERMGVLRHVMRYLQWDHGIAASDVEEHVLDLMDHDPLRFPLLSWVFAYFDLFPTVAVGWHAFYREVGEMVVEDFGLDPDDSGLRCVLALQEFLMPAPGRSFPAEIELEHDYVAYYRSATRELFTSGHARLPEVPLRELGPTTVTVAGDPLGLCTDGIYLEGDSRSEVMQGDFHIGAAVANELESPLTRILPALSFHGYTNVPPEVLLAAGEDPDDGLGHAEDGTDLDIDVVAEPVTVSISRRP